MIFINKLQKLDSSAAPIKGLIEKIAYLESILRKNREKVEDEERQRKAEELKKADLALTVHVD